MDDDLLADDGQFKDDGLDDLDIDQEAALLGLSDEEAEGERAEQELEYIDEDGNPVDIGENNAELYEVANIEASDKLSNLGDDDVLELDLDAELDSFTQEDPDLLVRESPAKGYNDNLISLTSQTERDKPTARRKEPRHSPERTNERNKNENYSNQSHSSRHDARDSFFQEQAYDEESEDESVEDDHRERFKSERSNIITLTPAKKRADIPDTLESVISKEETAKIQAFLENEQKRKMRFKGKNPARMKNIGRFQRPHQTFSGMPAPQTQYASSNASQVAPTTSTQPRKILINPHFRGLRLPPPTPSDQVHTIEETPQVSVPPVSYETSQNFPPPTYSHELPPQIPVAPPVFSTPPPSVPYKQPDYSSSSHIQQPPPSMWPTTPDMTPNTYTAPPPVLNYTDHLTQVPPNYHSSYSLNSFPTTSYQSTPVPLPQTVNYSQMPPPIHVQSSSYAPPPVVSAPPTYVTAMHYSNNQQRSQELNLHQQYHDHGKVQHSAAQHIQRNKFSQNQRFSRPEKRPANSNIKPVPIKQLRMEHPQKKSNIHVNNSNIREIPLVDTLPSTTLKEEKKKPVPIVEEEDEKTKELRMKIEEQKLLRAQILKRKEERRRQMAAQRLLELKKRQAEQNKNIVTISQKPEQQNVIKLPQAQVALQTKISVKERIGLPPNKTSVPMKKKIIVVRKKVPPVSNSAVVPPEVKKIPNVGQKPGLQTVTQSQKIQLQNKTAGIKPNQVSKPSVVSTQPAQDSSMQKNLPENKSETAKPEIKVNVVANEKKSTQIASQPPKGKVIRLQTRRQSFQRPPFHPPLNIPNQRMPGPPPRFAGPRGPQFHSPPFMEHRMRFPGHGPPMNDMRMPPPPFQEPRPPLLPYMPPGERGPFNQFFPPDGPFEGNKPPFRMRAPGFQNFPPRGIDMFRERFPPPQFPNQMPPMRQMFERNGPGFQRPRFQNLSAKKKPLPAKPIANQQKPSNDCKNTQPKESGVASDSQAVANQNAMPKQAITLVTKSSEEKQIIKLNSKNVLSENPNIPKTQSVSVENLSSSTNEMQLKKLCSSVGVVENIQLLKAERKAVIKFKEPIQALNFQKKYQRYMLDLAMIQVSLISA